MERIFVAICLLSAVFCGGVAYGVEPNSARQNGAEASSGDERHVGGGLPTPKLPTLGGKQFWSDELVYRGWRIQRNVLTGHCRLLDDREVRHLSGTYEACLERFNQLKRQRQLPSIEGKVVVLLHGLGRSRDSMEGLAKYLEEQGGYTAVTVSYASTRASLANHAQRLEGILKQLDGAERIDFVAHSMGNLVIRHYLADQTDPQQQRRPDPRFHRFVMLAPPNNGASMAERFKDNMLLQLVWGVAGQQLAEHFQELQDRLATPEFEFGVLAGNADGGEGNPLLPGPDDLVVTVEETKLSGAADLLVLPVIHTYIMDDAEARACTLRFLEHGYFRSPELRQPLNAERVPMERVPMEMP